MVDPTLSLWQGLDRLAFCENAILLELKDMSQGPIITSRKDKETQCKLGSFNDRLTESFLDDMALLAAGPGVRVARNEGFGGTACNDLQEVIDLGYHRCDHLNHGCETNTALHFDSVTEDVINSPMLRKAVRICTGRLRKHINGLLGELKHAGCRQTSQSRLPPYLNDSRLTASHKEVALFGAYCRENHVSYANSVQKRMNSLRTLSSNIGKNIDDDVSNLCLIAWTAYTLHHSSLLRRWLQVNLCIVTKPSALSSLIENILKRVGKLSRVFRAVRTITKFLSSSAQAAASMKVVGMETQKLQVHELRHRTIADLQGRSGKSLVGCHHVKLLNMLGRWSKYRVHAEIQLLMFYERHTDTTLATDYIGGDKLCCYLCYQFIMMHGRFGVNGCHQSLYSLWMIPDDVAGLSTEAADHLHATLKRLCALLQEKIALMSLPAAFKSPYHPQRESCDNLSRVSFFTNVSNRHPPQDRPPKINQHKQYLIPLTEHGEDLVHRPERGTSQNEVAEAFLSESAVVSTSDVDVSSATEVNEVSIVLKTPLGSIEAVLPSPHEEPSSLNADVMMPSRSVTSQQINQEEKSVIPCYGQQIRQRQHRRRRRRRRHCKKKARVPRKQQRREHRGHLRKAYIRFWTKLKSAFSFDMFCM
ncbi:hypothetical protein LTS08_008835 [Lithohypha guttulata]|uniref:Uncharacterized protein n=1 Tax=Lithohypha guttulata TaxID=1690604 RepID=A0ABR0K1J0_9EURO|nr:hypothetical protein LTR24_007945 [Lithohypha guttulata]KAK5093749.1 hypothetical protein LTS08_008835 [Lithohypha guttulata]KAK5313372.1 hypothetical protein LTR70_007676 [Exophiala xenobiotica]